MASTTRELIRIELGIIQLCPLHRESIHRHLGLCRITEFGPMTSSENFPNKLRSVHAY